MQSFVPGGKEKLEKVRASLEKIRNADKMDLAKVRKNYAKVTESLRFIESLVMQENAIKVNLKNVMQMAGPAERQIEAACTVFEIFILCQKVQFALYQRFMILKLSEIHETKKDPESMLKMIQTAEREILEFAQDVKNN